MRGARCWYVAEAVVNHVGSATFGQKSDNAIYHGHRNLVWVYWKNMPPRLFWQYLPAHFFMNVLYLIYFSFTGHARAIWRAKLHALRGLGATLHKRREIQRMRVVEAAGLRRLMDCRWLSVFPRWR